MTEKHFDPAVLNQPLPNSKRPKSFGKRKGKGKHPWDQSYKVTDKHIPPEIIGNSNGIEYTDSLLEAIDKS